MPKPRLTKLEKLAQRIDSNEPPHSKDTPEVINRWYQHQMGKLEGELRSKFALDWHSDSCYAGLLRSQGVTPPEFAPKTSGSKVERVRNYAAALQTLEGKYVIVILTEKH